MSRRKMVLQLTTTGGTIFGFTALLNGYRVIPSDEDDPNGWHGDVPDKEIPFNIGASGVAGSTYTVTFEITREGTSTSDKKTIDRTIPPAGQDSYPGVV